MEINRVVIEEWQESVKHIYCPNYEKCLDASLSTRNNSAIFFEYEKSWTCAECPCYLQAPEPEPVQFYFRTTSVPAKFREMIQQII